jgi:hypothetical protein
MKRTSKIISSRFWILLADNKSEANMNMDAASDLGLILDHLKIARDQVKEFHTFWNVVHDCLKLVLTKLKVLYTRYRKTSRINTINTQVIQGNWKKAQALLIQYREDIDMEIRKICVP